MRHIVFVILLVFFGSVENEKNSELELKIDYYEALIKKAVKDAANYKPRIDNSDFLSDVDRTKVHDYGQFDFIIVGAGTTGCVVANRLSENPDWKILALEAGGSEDDLSEIPGIHTLSSNIRKNWGYVSIKQEKGCLGMIDQRCLVTRGLSEGGSSATGALIYSRGVEQDYDNWASKGNPGWSFEKILPYFKKVENYRITKNRINHGSSGPINIEYSEPKSLFHQAIVDGMKELSNEDKSAENKTNNSLRRIEYNIWQGRRVSSANSYLKEAKTRTNTNVTNKAFVTKILISSDKRAYGVEFVKNRELYRATATKEVILSGGAINTPQLLMLSGIGPKQILKKHKIEIVHDLPVGQTLKDHFGYLSIYIRTNSTQNTPPLRELLRQYLNGYGYLTKSLNSEFLGYFSRNTSSMNRPSIEYIFAPPTGTRIGLYATKRFTNEMTASVSRQVNISTDISVSVTLLHPKSKGEIRLKSANPIDFPEIDIGMFQNKEDIEEIYEGIRNILRLLETESFRKLNASIYSIPKPCEAYEFNSRSFWYCSIKHIAFAAHQLTSSTKMGPASDAEAVVDDSLRVRGVRNLRIADCGVIPVTLSGQLNAVAYVIGEKAADLIKQQYSSNYVKEEL
ncbi:glucose dehydrogenase [FAD, quinone]-like isoform X1 [Coccinella septempunctata]|uniref:glucose dehydrogenase [FAD, quinone]-like isoform X1 n=1 Tax=Coccinella septempunctata TaxID=41139 RepID=UPI001D0817B9|nr:glucose dehydrogenase [FAD, quinone]-like isoform X1 [Coccinella septempunctata]